MTTDQLTIVQRAAIAAAQADGWTVTARGARKIVATKGKAVRYLAGGVDNPSWADMQVLPKIEAPVLV